MVALPDPLWQFQAPAPLRGLAVAPDGSRVAVCSGGWLHHELNVLDGAGRLQWSRRPRNGLDLVAFSATGPNLLVDSIGPDFKVEVCDGTGHAVGEWVTGRNFWRGGQLMGASISDDASCFVIAFQGESGHQVTLIKRGSASATKERPDHVLEMATSRDGSLVGTISARYSGVTVAIWSDYRLRLFGALLEERFDVAFDLDVRNIRISPSGRLVAAEVGRNFGANRIVVLDDNGSEKWSSTCEVPTAPVGFLPDGSLWACRAPKRRAKGVLELVLFGPGGAPMRTITSREERARFAASSSLDDFAWGYNSGRVSLLNAIGTPRGDWDAGAPVLRLAVADGGGLVVAGTRDSTVAAFSPG